MRLLNRTIPVTRKWTRSIDIRCGILTNPNVRILPALEAVRVYGSVLIEHTFLSVRVLGKLVALIRDDKDSSACIFGE